MKSMDYLLSGTTRGNGRGTVIADRAHAVGSAVVDQLRAEGVARGRLIVGLVVDGDVSRKGELVLLANAVSSGRQIRRESPLRIGGGEIQGLLVADARHVVGLNVLVNGNDTAATSATPTTSR